MNQDSPFNHIKPVALITGINGFTGPYVARELEDAGYKVVGVSNSGTADNETLFKVNLCHSESVIRLIETVRPNVVVHLAAISFVPHNNIEEIYQVNIVATRNLLQALSQTDLDLTAVLLASTSHVYGKSAAGKLSETSAFNPENDYAVSKLSMEYMARLWIELLPIFFVRPFNYTGVGQAPHFLIPKIVSHYARGKREIELGNINVIRDFSDVRMVATYYKKLIAAIPIGRALNICSGEGYSIHQILNFLAEIAGYAITVRVNPTFVRPDEVKESIGDNGNLRSVIGDMPTIPLKQTLEWMYMHYKQCDNG